MHQVLKHLVYYVVGLLKYPQMPKQTNNSYATQQCLIRAIKNHLKPAHILILIQWNLVMILQSHRQSNGNIH